MPRRTRERRSADAVPPMLHFKRYVFLDLENLAFLADSLQPLSILCRQSGIEFRSYCAPDHAHAGRATHVTRSNEKEAADVCMVWDAAKLSLECDLKLLLISDDIFGRTLAAEQSDVFHVAFDDPLPQDWVERFGASSMQEFFERLDVHRERRARTPSVVSVRSKSRASWSRAASTVAPRRPPRRERLLQGGGGYTSDYGAQTDAETSDGEDADQVAALAEEDPAIRRWEIRQEQAWQEQARQEAKALMSRLALAEQQRDEATAKLREQQRGAGGQARAQRSKSGPRKWPPGQKPSSGKQVGTVEKWNEKGFGFIKPGSGRKTIFFHIKELKMEHAAGKKQQLNQLLRWDVEFRIAQGDKGPQAVQVSGPKGRALPADA